MAIKRYRRLTASELKKRGKSTKTVLYKAVNGRKVYSRKEFESKIRPTLESYQLPSFFAHTKRAAKKTPQKTDWIKNLYRHLAKPNTDFDGWWRENGAVVRSYYLRYEKTGKLYQTERMKALVKSQDFLDVFDNVDIPDLIGSPDLGDFFDDPEAKKEWYQEQKRKR